MFNLPITDTFGVRLAGTYLKRDGFTKNLFDNSRIDDRDLYAVRGTVSWEPTSDTRLDLMAYYFREDDNRSRIQKQLCNRDPTGVLGCAPDRLEFEVPNGNSTLAAVLSSREFYPIALGQTPLAFLGPVFAQFGLQSLCWRGRPPRRPYCQCRLPPDLFRRRRAIYGQALPRLRPGLGQPDRRLHSQRRTVSQRL
jgi:outer membrane receptor protein involved in Fe transport